MRKACAGGQPGRTSRRQETLTAARPRRANKLQRTLDVRLQTAFFFCLLPALAIAPPAAAQAYVNLGGVNLNYYCAKTFGNAFKSILIGKTAGDWRCQKYKSKEEPKSISVQHA